MRVRYLIVASLFPIVVKLPAQSFQYSQYNMAGPHVNPGMVGSTRYASAAFLYRNQKTGGDFNINSNFLNLEYPFLNRSTGKPWSGIAVTLMDDHSSGIYVTQEASVTYALHVQVGRYETLSFGARGVFLSNKISLDGFYTGAQYIPDRGFDTNLSNGETFASIRSNLHTFSTGLQWLKKDRYDHELGYAGLALFDFNKPSVGFMSHQELPSTLVFNLGFEAYQRDQLRLYPELLYSFASTNSVLNAGARWSYELKGPVNQYRNHIDLLTKYVVGRSGILGLQLHTENFSAGLSYDFPVFIRNAGNLGALEISIQLRRIVFTRPQRQRTRRLSHQQSGKATQQTQRKETPSAVQIERSTSADSLLTHLPEDERTKEQDPTDSLSVIPSAEAGAISMAPFVVEKITMNFGFEFNSSELDDTSEDFLNDLAATLKENTALTLVIKGYTDNIGSAKFNQRLSLKRAESVRTFMIRQGIEPDRLKVEGLGMEFPVADNETEEGRARNRRVELLVTYGHR